MTQSPSPNLTMQQQPPPIDLKPYFLVLSDIEEAYWDLYFAYRDLDAKIAARDSALEAYREMKGEA